MLADKKKGTGKDQPTFFFSCSGEDLLQVNVCNGYKVEYPIMRRR